MPSKYRHITYKEYKALGYTNGDVGMGCPHDECRETYQHLPPIPPRPLACDGNVTKQECPRCIWIGMYAKYDNFIETSPDMESGAKTEAAASEKGDFPMASFKNQNKPATDLLSDIAKIAFNEVKYTGTRGSAIQSLLVNAGVTAGSSSVCSDTSKASIKTALGQAVAALQAVQAAI